MPKNFYRKYRIRAKHHFDEVMKTKTSSDSIALGFSVGTFISLLPIPGIDIFLGLLVVMINEKINKYALITSIMIVWNPLIVAPFYLLSYKLGSLMFNNSGIIEYELSFMDQVFNFTRRFLIGNLIIAITVSVLSYFLVKFAVEKYRRKVEQ